METKKIDSNTKKGIVIDPVLPRMPVEERLFITGDYRREGGMGSVEEVYDDNLKRCLVRKTIRETYRGDTLVETRFIEEAQTAGQLQHPNIVPIHELGVDDEGRLFFTMKKIEGLSFEELVKKTPIGHRTWRDLYEHLQIFVRVCDVVSFMHSHGVIHRDIKPNNVMIGEFGEVYLIDYGIMKVLEKHPNVTTPPRGTASYERHVDLVVTDSASAPGDPAYASPEQGKSSKLDERTDVFLLGGLLFFIINQRPPYSARDTTELIEKVRQGEVDSLEDAAVADVPAPIRRIAERAMQTRPEDRFQSAAELKDAVVNALIAPWPSRRRVFKPGTTLIQEGDKGHTAYTILEGTCRVYKTVDGRRQPVRTLGPKEVFGETALFSHQVRTASVEAADRLVVEEIEKQAFDEGMPHWLSPFVRALAKRFVERDEQHATRTHVLLEANIVIQLLKLMNLIGAQAPDGSRTASWSELRSRVSDYFDVPGDVVHEAVEKRNLFKIDFKNDTAILTAAEG